MSLNEQEALQYLGNTCIYYINDRSWDQIQLKVEIFTKMVSPCFSHIYNKILFDKVENLPLEQNMMIYDASLALRDHILNLTCDRIWGLTFKLYPNGKLNIEYDYQKPKDYEESEETISGDDKLNKL